MKPDKPHLPAEWEHQTGVLLSWPTKSTDWRDNLAAVEATYIELTRLIALHSHAYICCDNDDTRQHVQYCCDKAGISPERFELFTIPYDDTWTRDYGPISVKKDNDAFWLNFDFNAWGNKYPHIQDNQLTTTLHKQTGHKSILENIDFILEGGSIDSDGNGSLLTTSQCLLHPSRNAGRSKEQLEDVLIPLLGLKRILWLNHGGIAGDDTDAHIDTLARFCSNDTIVYVQCTDATDPHFESLSRMEKQLQSFTQLNGQPYKLIPLPHATACFNQQGQQLPPTYTNFLILNGHVLAPVYDVETDKLALVQLQKAFPGYSIIPVNCRPLIEQFGSLHCITMQIL